ncbi:NAD(P)/FAD-dependent oxidoreductase (plasmid) [Novosphingobium resinovorum]|uniref:FAD-dependent oxidoreductase n=1 Tax=Novosphingobium TaxID=165696 RepID=UPI0020030B62|nr:MULTISPECIES: NAD(P)/FAD-dependent oxidoreductase [Novosphingobium]MBF7015289.1 FAD-dependent monooxygenase [Novosphingobium sp. HR1a]WJM30383.1 NAD(P)/FAD-dependent oxidoreductase [Novosphingobium resinovorum]
MGLKAIVSGGGIGGLSTATALAQRGWNVTVYESQPTLRVTGSGIYVHSNGLAVLSALGAFDRAMRGAFMGDGVEQRDHRGGIILPASMPPGVMMVSIPRFDLMESLADAARNVGVEIVTGALVVDARADGTLIFSNGRKITADLAIGCDGIWSPVRKALNLEEFHQRTAEGALRTIVKGTQAEMPPEARNRCIENWSGTRRLLITPINDEEIYLALTCLSDDVEASDTRVLPCWRESFPDWAWLIDRIGEEVTWNVYSHIRCKQWSAGRTAILGDAAHAQPPNLGQGGGMALQNGLALAAYMADVQDRRDIPDALAAWEAAVRPLTEHCQYWSVLFGEITRIPDDIRSTFIRSAFTNAWVRESLGAAAASTPIVRKAG